MERSGPIPAGAVRPDDIVEIVGRPGPFATVWTARSGAGPWGRTADGAVARDALAELRQQHAPAHVVESVRQALDALDPAARGAVIVADATGVLLAEGLPRPPRWDVARWAATPSLAAVLEHRQADIAVIVVFADRLGADVIVRRPGHDETAEVVEGGNEGITKVASGGWSQHRYQQRAEDSWEHNAGVVADRLTRLAASVRPELMVLGGDERAVTLITHALPTELRHILRTIAPGRAEDGSSAQRDAKVERLVDTVVARETVDLVREFQEQTGRRAANGPEETVAALQLAQIDTLLVHDQADDEREAFISAGTGQVALDRAELEALGIDDATSARLVDAAIVAALRTSAAVRIVPDVASVDRGLAAVLRWS